PNRASRAPAQPAVRQSARTPGGARKDCGHLPPRSGGVSVRNNLTDLRLDRKYGYMSSSRAADGAHRATAAGRHCEAGGTARRAAPRGGATFYGLAGLAVEVSVDGADG